MTAAPGARRRERLRSARLYLVLEAEPAGRAPDELLSSALAGGVDMVQLRDKHASDANLLTAAERFRRLCHEYGALFWVNDRPDLARAAGADGVHVGQDDMPPAQARRAVGPDLLVGLSTHAPEELDAALADPWFAIGGIDTGNVDEVMAAGAERIVVVRAIRDAADPRAVAAELRAALERKSVGPER